MCLSDFENASFVYNKKLIVRKVKMNNEELNDLKSSLRKLGWSPEAVDLGIAQKFRCCYCGRDLLRSIEDYDVWNFDHIIPLSKGGTNDTKNKVVACKLCNFVKRNFDVRAIAGNDASKEELFALAKAHISSRRSEKKAKLKEIKKLLFEAGHIDEDRFEECED